MQNGAKKSAYVFLSYFFHFSELSLSDDILHGEIKTLESMFDSASNL